MKCNAEIAAAKVASMFEGMGVPLDHDAFDGMQLEGKAAFAKNSNVYDTALAQDTALRHRNDIDSIASGNLQKLFGSKYGSYLTLSKDPGVILGERFIKPLTDALQFHLEDFPDRSGAEALQAYKDDVLPVVRELKDKIQDEFSDHGQINYANRYLSAWEQGGKFYNSGSDIAKIANTLPDTMVKNLVSNNPFITMANVFEFMPKSLGIYGVPATLKGMVNFARATKGNPFRRIPELESHAVYDTPHSGLLGKFDLINTTETPFRGLAYHVAEAAGKEGLEGVQKIAFKYRPGREPLILMEHGSAATVALMRFGIESTKMYGEWYKNILTGSMKEKAEAATGLALFHAMTALQTGIGSSVPAPIWGLMNQEQKDACSELDDALGSNVFKHTTGQSIEAGRMQPLSPVALGVGYDLANSAINQGYQGTKKGVAELQDGDYLQAGVHFTKGMLSAGQTFVPGLNTSVRKVGDIMLDTLSGEIQPEEIPAQAGKKLIGLDIK
jgi:hypothetical protein